MKKLLLTSALATTLASGSVLANPAVQQGDLDQIFAGKTQSIQVSTLSGQEMKETEGAWAVPGAVVGGLAGGVQYGASCMVAGNCTWKGAAYNVAGGAALGFIGGPVSIGRSILAVKYAAPVGVGNGIGTRRGWW